jgi:hypothetical protein
MLDREGFRPNVGIVLLNTRNEVFWGKRLRTHSWQFPQGGIKHGESPEQAMFRELHEADHWYIIYHRRPIPNEGRDHRVTCIDKLEFNEDGTIKNVKMTFTGVAKEVIQ